MQICFEKNLFLNVNTGKHQISHDWIFSRSIFFGGRLNFDPNLGIEITGPGRVDAQPPREPVAQHQVVHPGQGEIVSHLILERERWGCWGHSGVAEG